MSAISQKSISGITSITSPAGTDDQISLHTSNTNEALKIDGAGNLHIHNHLSTTGVSTASNFKTGTSNLHNTGLNVQDLDVDGHTNLDNVSIAGVTTMTGNLTVSNNAPKIILNDADTDSDFRIVVASGNFRIQDVTNGNANRLSINSGGNATFTSTATFTSNVNIDGNLDVDGHTNLDNVSIAGVTTASTINSTGNIEIDVDNGEFRCGAGGDFKISHSGSENILRSDFPTVFRNSANNETLAKFTPNGAVELYHDNVKQFETYSAGVTVSGGQVNVNPSSGNATLQLKSGSGSVYTNIYFKAADNTQTSYITSWSGGNLYFSTTSALVSSIGGTEITEVTSTGFHPKTDSSRDLGKTGTRWANVYADTLYGDGSNLTGITGTTINNNADNRIITGSGTANTLNGESSVVIDSNSNVIVGGTGVGNASTYARNIVVTGSSNRGMTIHTTDTSGSNRKCCIFFGTGTSVSDMADGMLFYDNAGQYFHMSTAGAGTGVTKSSMRLAGDGTVRFDSTPTATNSISLLLKSHKARAVNDNNGILFRDANDHSQAAMYVQKKSTSDGTSDLVFSVSSGQVVNSLQGIPEKLRLKSGGDLSIADGNLVIASGPHGIDFSADSSQTLQALANSFNAEVLHDYEVGTFVPNIQYDTGTNQYYGSPGSGQSVSSSKGEYIRIGDMVWAAGEITLVANRNSTQTVHISIGGFPYNGMHTSQQNSLQTGWGGAAWPKNDSNGSYRIYYSYHSYTTLNFAFKQTAGNNGIDGFRFHAYYRCPT